MDLRGRDFLKLLDFTEDEINKIINKYDGSLDSFMFISDNVEDVIDYLVNVSGFEIRSLINNIETLAYISKDQDVPQNLKSVF